jgi:hypothetical protein
MLEQISKALSRAGNLAAPALMTQLRECVAALGEISKALGK